MKYYFRGSEASFWQQDASLRSTFSGCEYEPRVDIKESGISMSSPAPAIAQASLANTRNYATQRGPKVSAFISPTEVPSVFRLPAARVMQPYPLSAEPQA
ncbi:hypothetical protein, partial [Burkholderia ubonensis]|uniref:hypothetical protein n=1 Tax=Burkholderia ubonensis TaxID=101571 RepID=UPI001E2961ED